MFASSATYLAAPLKQSNYPGRLSRKIRRGYAITLQQRTRGYENAYSAARYICRQPECDSAAEAPLALTDRVVVISRFDDPASLRSARNDADVTAPHDDRSDAWSVCAHAVMSPVAGEIVRAIGNAEIVPHPPAAPGAWTRIVATANRRSGRDTRRAPSGRRRRCFGVSGRGFCVTLRDRFAAETIALNLRGQMTRVMMTICVVMICAVMRACECRSRDRASKRSRDGGEPSFHCYYPLCC